jgi:hypothetical protein
VTSPIGGNLADSVFSRVTGQVDSGFGFLGRTQIRTAKNPSASCDSNPFESAGISVGICPPQTSVSGGGRHVTAKMQSSPGGNSLKLVRAQGPGNHRFNCAHEIPSLCFRNHRGDARLASGFGQAREIQDREQHERHLRVQRGHALGRFEAVDVGHRKVDQHEVWFQFLKLRDTRETVLGLPAHGPFTGMDNRSKDAASRLGIVHDQDAQIHGRILTRGQGRRNTDFRVCVECTVSLPRSVREVKQTGEHRGRRVPIGDSLDGSARFHANERASSREDEGRGCKPSRR